jgi:non-ribosomal peptide synthetase component E (peptide arylation enzyme)
MATKRRRSGTTETFSVSVDRDTKAALRALADSEFGGNLSALITDFAEEARRRKAADDYLRRHGIARLTKPDALQAEIATEVTAATAAAKRRSRKRKVA